MRLTDYMRAKGLTPEVFADLVGGVSASGVRKWMVGERIPRRDQMGRIVEITNRSVTPNDFFDLGSSQPQRPAAGDDLDPDTIPQDAIASTAGPSFVPRGGPAFLGQPVQEAAE